MEPEGPSETDGDLVRGALAGERAAFEALLRRHYDRVHRLAWRMTGSQSDAEDIAQDVCCVLVEKLGGFKGEAKFTTWLTGITLNACRDHHRRRSVQSRFREGLAVLSRLSANPDGRDLYRQGWLASDLGRLDPALRETVLLVAGEDLTHAEAADALGVAELTVSWRLFEARRRLAAPASVDEEGQGR